LAGDAEVLGGDGVVSIGAMCKSPLHRWPVAAAEQREAAFGCAAVVKSCASVCQVDRAFRVYDCFAAERSLALLVSCYKATNDRKQWLKMRVTYTGINIGN
jgi:hypothetical protein